LFSDRELLLARRRQQLTKEDYQPKYRLLPAIEGTISQFKQRTPKAKVRVRGLWEGAQQRHFDGYGPKLGPDMGLLLGKYP
jgi:predicted RNA-binding protein associated with RNAse of E/G family